ncbi:hypothetical protein KGQ20_20550, partial [Catenulispora sp. NF23]
MWAEDALPEGLAVFGPEAVPDAEPEEPPRVGAEEIDPVSPVEPAPSVDPVDPVDPVAPAADDDVSVAPPAGAEAVLVEVGADPDAAGLEDEQALSARAAQRVMAADESVIFVDMPPR